jgi:hypothetical protein
MFVTLSGLIMCGTIRTARKWNEKLESRLKLYRIMRVPTVYKSREFSLHNTDATKEAQHSISECMKAI